MDAQIEANKQAKYERQQQLAAEQITQRNLERAQGTRPTTRILRPNTGIAGASRFDTSSATKRALSGKTRLPYRQPQSHQPVQQTGGSQQAGPSGIGHRPSNASSYAQATYLGAPPSAHTRDMDRFWKDQIEKFGQDELWLRVADRRYTETVVFGVDRQNTVTRNTPNVSHLDAYNYEVPQARSSLKTYDWEQFPELKPEAVMSEFSAQQNESVLRPRFAQRPGLSYKQCGGLPVNEHTGGEKELLSPTVTSQVHQEAVKWFAENANRFILPVDEYSMKIIQDIGIRMATDGPRFLQLAAAQGATHVFRGIFNLTNITSMWRPPTDGPYFDDPRLIGSEKQMVNLKRTDI